MQLLHARGVDQVESEQGTKIFLLLVVLVQIRCLTTMEGDMTFFKSCLQNVRLLDHVRVADLLEVTNFTSVTIDAVVNINLALNRSRNHYDQSALRRVLIDVVELEASLYTTTLESALQTTTSPFDVMLSNQYRTSYIRMLQLVLELVETIQSHDTTAAGDFFLESTYSKFACAISTQAELVLDILPMVLGPNFLSDQAGAEQTETPLFDRATSWSDILRLLWPLRMIALGPQYIRSEQFDRISQALQHISKKYGIGRCVEGFPLATLSFADPTG